MKSFDTTQKQDTVHELFMSNIVDDMNFLCDSMNTYGRLLFGATMLFPFYHSPNDERFAVKTVGSDHMDSELIAELLKALHDQKPNDNTVRINANTGNMETFFTSRRGEVVEVVFSNSSGDEEQSIVNDFLLAKNGDYPSVMLYPSKNTAVSTNTTGNHYVVNNDIWDNSVTEDMKNFEFLIFQATRAITGFLSSLSESDSNESVTRESLESYVNTSPRNGSQPLVEWLGLLGCSLLNQWTGNTRWTRGIVV